MAPHEHSHDHEQENEESFGMALGFRIFPYQEELYLAEVEITPYVDEPDALGATLVFHPLAGLNPTTNDEELDWPAYPVDIDDDLTRDPGTAMTEQFQAILRQLSGLSEARLAEYLQQALADAENDEEEA